MLCLSSSIRLRPEPFGSFLFFRKSQQVARLNHLETLIAQAFLESRIEEQVAKVISLALQCDCHEITLLVARLREAHILRPTRRPAVPFAHRTWAELCSRQEQIALTKPFADPVWMHIQPWTICNLTCKHCYCFASPYGTPSHLQIEEWFALIDHFGNMNVFELFLTGGEVLINERFWELATHARKRDLVVRTTTNGTVVSPDTPARLVEELGMDKIQVSLDGASPATHDPFRGVDGSFARTVNGIRRLRTRLQVSLEVTMHRLNYHEVDEIVKLAAELGCIEVKFVNLFPTGRGYHIFGDYQLSPDQKIRLIERYQALQSLYPTVQLSYGSNCNDITQKESAICTAGVVGANVDERGNVLPCIMGIAIPTLYAGNVRQAPFPTIWYHADLLTRMRSLPEQPGASCSACSWQAECKSRCAVIAHTTQQQPCHLSPTNPQSHFCGPVANVCR